MAITIKCDRCGYESSSLSGMYRFGVSFRELSPDGDYADETYHELCVWCQQEIKDGVSALMKPVVRNWHANSLMSATVFMQFDSEESEHGKQD